MKLLYVVGFCASVLASSSGCGDGSAGSLPAATSSGSDATAAGPDADAGDADADAGSDGTEPPCGFVGAPCCQSEGCDGDLVCASNVCVEKPNNGTGQPCAANGDCPEGICFPAGLPEGEGNVCTAPCTGAADCVAGWACEPLIGQPSEICQCSYTPEVCDGKDNDCDGIPDDDPPCEGGKVCEAGYCVCPQDTCGGQCVDVSSDDNHCGACGVACSADTSCQDGVCVCDIAGLTSCGASCTDTNADTDHCGECGNACATGANCQRGTCDCPGAGGTACGGQCVETSIDEAHCGACGVECAAGASCDQGECTCPGTDGIVCNGQCVDAAVSGQHCGSCGNACGAEPCVNGSCGCPAGTEYCAGDCVNTSNDLDNCNGCGNVCSYPNAQASCVGGSCNFVACLPTHGNCDNNPANGCEHQLGGNASCTACNVGCPSGTFCTSNGVDQPFCS